MDQDFFKNVLNSIRDFVLIKDPNSNLLWANKSFLDYYGMSENDLEEIVDGPQSDPDDTLQYIRDDLKVIESGQHLNISSEPVTDSQGNIKYFHTIKSPVFEGSKVIHSIGISRLIDDSEIENQYSQIDAKTYTAPLRSIIDNLPIKCMLLDQNFRTIICSNNWINVFGDTQYTSSKTFCSFYKELEPLKKEIYNSLKNEKEIEVDLKLDSNGFSKIISFKISPWSYPNNDLGGVLVIALDITDQKKNEESLILANEELSQFAYRASHDLKSPLVTARSLAVAALEDIENDDLDEAIENLNRVCKSILKLENVVQDILNLAESDLSPNELCELRLSDLVHEVSSSLSKASKDKAVTIEVGNDGTFKSSRSVITRVLENLISNSIKYSNPSIESSYVKLSYKLIENKDTLIIEDNGVGIPDRFHSKIFNMFERFHPKLAEGTGLGMYLVKKNLLRLNASIKFDSSDIGTKFVITL